MLIFPNHSHLLLSVFQAKKEIYAVKEQRLMLAQDEFIHLNETLSGWKSSRTSCEYSLLYNIISSTIIILWTKVEDVLEFMMS